jgi:hypothetical protein
MTPVSLFLCRATGDLFFGRYKSSAGPTFLILITYKCKPLVR